MLLNEEGKEAKNKQNYTGSHVLLRTFIDTSISTIIIKTQLSTQIW